MGIGVDDSMFGIFGKGCGNCTRSYTGHDDAHVGCGAAFEDNPIWAIRKYSMKGIYDALNAPNDTYLGHDCDKMRSDDGGHLCRAYRQRKE